MKIQGTHYVKDLNANMYKYVTFIVVHKSDLYQYCKMQQAQNV